MILKVIKTVHFSNAALSFCAARRSFSEYPRPRDLRRCIQFNTACSAFRLYSCSETNIGCLSMSATTVASVPSVSYVALQILHPRKADFHGTDLNYTLSPFLPDMCLAFPLQTWSLFLHKQRICLKSHQPLMLWVASSHSSVLGTLQINFSISPLYPSS